MIATKREHVNTEEIQKSIFLNNFPCVEIKHSLTLWCKFLWMEFDILVHVPVTLGIFIIFIFGNMVANKPANGCQQNLSVNT